MRLSTEILRKMETAEIVTLHNLLHEAADQERDDLLLHLNLHQEIVDRGILLKSGDVDEQVSEIALEVGLSHEDVSSLGLPLTKEDTSVESTPDLRLVHLAKEDEEERIILGIVLEPNAVDSYKHTVTKEEIRKAAHDWLAYKQVRKLSHQKVANEKMVILESYLAPVDLTFGKEIVKEGSWLLAMRVTDDELWKSIKEGKITGYSMGGWAVLEDLKDKGESDDNGDQ